MGSRAGTGGRLARRSSGVLLTVAACLAAGFGLPGARATSPVAPPADGVEMETLVVRLDRPSTKEREAALAASVGGRRIRSVRPGVFQVDVARGRGGDAARRLAAAEGVELAEPDVRFSAAGIVPNEECFSGCLLTFDNGTTSERFSQDEMVRVGAPDAWVITRGDPDALVAVVDTDVDETQPDLAGKVVVGKNFSGDLNPDPHGHGTAVAGLIAAQPDNGIGIAGLGWSTKVLAVRVLDSQGAGLASEIAAGIRYAADYPGVRVINMSLQQDVADAGRVSTELQEAIEYAQSARNAQRRPVLVVAAAGNQGRTEPSYPAAFRGVLSVTAVDETDATASFSNRGTWVDLAAPGVRVLTVAPGCDCWATPDGTSFAAPFVSAAAALVMAANPGVTAEQVADRLEATAERVAGTGQDFRAGRLNVARALVSPLAPPAPPVSKNPPTPPPPAPPSPPAVSSTGTPTPIPAAGGYWLVGSDGGIFTYGTAAFHGSTGNLALNQPIVGLAASPSGNGYWMVASDGGIFTFGDAGFFGSTGAVRLNQPIVGMAPTPTGRGYWLVASDGGIFSFGDAGFFGSTGAVRLNQPIVGMAPTPTGRGYWLVASDGGIFAFGDAGFHGSTGALNLAGSIVGMAPTSSGLGYWLVASDGGVFTFGDARFFGAASAAGASGVIGLAPAPAGDGYWIVGVDGTVFNFGSAPVLGSPRGSALNKPIVGVAVR